MTQIPGGTPQGKGQAGAAGRFLAIVSLPEPGKGDELGRRKQMEPLRSGREGRGGESSASRRYFVRNYYMPYPVLRTFHAFPHLYFTKPPVIFTTSIF